MKKWIVLAGVVLLVFTGGYLVFSFYAVKFIEVRIQNAMGPEFTILQIQVRLTHLFIRGVRFEDPHNQQKFFHIEEAKIYPRLSSFLAKSFHIREFILLKPSLFFYRTRDGDVTGSWVPIEHEKKRGEASPREEKKREKIVPLRIDRLRIEKGSIDFEDLKAGETPGWIKLRDLKLTLKNVQYPVSSSRSPIDLKGKIEGKTETGEISSTGWIDLKSSDMEILIKMSGVELKTFEPYYRKNVTAEIESGNVSLDTSVTVKQRKIDAIGQVELTNLHIGGQGTVFYLPAETLASRLERKGNRINMPFHLKGDMDDPRFKLHEVFLTQMAFSFGEALGLPIKRKEMGRFQEGVRLLEELFKKKRK